MVFFLNNVFINKLISSVLVFFSGFRDVEEIVENDEKAKVYFFLFFLFFNKKITGKELV